MENGKRMKSACLNNIAVVFVLRRTLTCMHVHYANLFRVSRRRRTTSNGCRRHLSVCVVVCVYNGVGCRRRGERERAVSDAASARQRDGDSLQVPRPSLSYIAADVDQYPHS